MTTPVTGRDVFRLPWRGRKQHVGEAQLAPRPTRPGRDVHPIRMAGDEASPSGLPVHLVLRGCKIDSDRWCAGRREHDDSGCPACTAAVVIRAIGDIADRYLWVERCDICIEGAAERWLGDHWREEVETRRPALVDPIGDRELGPEPGGCRPVTGCARLSDPESGYEPNDARSQ